MELVIMAAGMGSRYGGLKQLDPIDDDGNFIIDYSIFDAIRCGFDKVIFIKAIFDDKISIGCSESLDIEEIACVAAYFKKKHNNVQRVQVEVKDENYYLIEGKHKGEMIIENAHSDKAKVYKPRVLKRLRLTF